MKAYIYEVIFGTDSGTGKAFDIALIFLILGSVVLVMLESVPGLPASTRALLPWFEWSITALFLVEYLVRIWVVRYPVVYLFSFFGVVDFLAILPSFLGLFVTGTHMLIVLRSLRLLRVFRILRLTNSDNEGRQLWRAMVLSRNRIGVFLVAVLIIVTILGTVMYLVERPFNEGFSSIPMSVYWAIVTLTTVGYGDIAPVTTIGQFLAGVIMILGYAIIAVPTGIVSTEMASLSKRKAVKLYACPSCKKDGHEADALFCKFCGLKL